MGIDKADGMRHFFVDISTTKPSPVRFVIHYTIPGSLLKYVHMPTAVEEVLLIHVSATIKRLVEQAGTESLPSV